MPGWLLVALAAGAGWCEAVGGRFARLPAPWSATGAVCQQRHERWGFFPEKKIPLENEAPAPRAP